MPVTLYVVRDEFAGELASWVSVWCDRPNLEPAGRENRRWWGSREEGIEGPVGWLTNYHVDEAMAEFGVVPRRVDQVILVKRRDPDDRARVERLLDGIDRRSPR